MLFILSYRILKICTVEGQETRCIKSFTLTASSGTFFSEKGMFGLECAVTTNTLGATASIQAEAQKILPTIAHMLIVRRHIMA